MSASTVHYKCPERGGSQVHVWLMGRCELCGTPRNHWRKLAHQIRLQTMKKQRDQRKGLCAA